MQLTVRRHTFTDFSTCGELLIDGEFFCFTLEPPNQPMKPCCIPAGTYPLVLEYSPRFRLNTPHVLDVPGFTDIEIHPGNYPIDTEGCTLVGKTQDIDYIGQSRQAFEELFGRLVGQKDMTITYTGGAFNA